MTPEAAYLAEQEQLLADLTEQLANEETEFASTSAEFDRFRVQYLRRFAPLYAALDSLEAEIARRRAVRANTVAAHAAAAEAASRAEESGEALRAAFDPVDGPVGDDVSRPEAPPELRDLYREAAKMIHPDLATDDEERSRRTSLMKSLNAAYAAADADAMARIIDGEASRPEAVTGDDVASRLVRVIRKLAQVRDRIDEIIRLSEALEADPLFVLFTQCRDALPLHEDPLAEDEVRLRARIAAARARRDALAKAEAGARGAGA